MKANTFLYISMAIIALVACREVDLDNDVSKQAKVEYQFAGPLVKGDILVEDLVNKYKEDSILLINGDTVFLVMKTDSIITYSKDSFALVPDQVTKTYEISPSSNIPQSVLTNSYMSPALNMDSAFIVKTIGGMRIDSAYMGQASINYTFTNTFKYDVDLMIESSSLIDPSGNNYSASQTVSAESSVNLVSDITGYKVITEKIGDSSAFRLSYTPVIKADSPNGDLEASQGVTIDVSLEGIENFEVMFGYAGNQSVQYDTSVSFSMDELHNITGTFNVTDPRIKIKYSSTFGMPISTDNIAITAFYDDKPNVVIDPGEIVFDPSDDYLNPYSSSSKTLTKQDDPDVTEIVSFPVTDSLSLRGILRANNNVTDPLQSNDFILGNSELVLGLDIIVPLEFRSDLTYRDTFELPIGEKVKNYAYIDYAHLHYWFTNGFPIGFDADIIIYDTINDLNLDTIPLNSFEDGAEFLVAAEIDQKGEVIKSSIEKRHGIAKLDEPTAENLLSENVAAIIVAKIITTEIKTARILKDSRLDFKFGLDAKGKYEGDVTKIF